MYRRRTPTTASGGPATESDVALSACEPCARDRACAVSPVRPGGRQGCARRMTTRLAQRTCWACLSVCALSTWPSNVSARSQTVRRRAAIHVDDRIPTATDSQLLDALFQLIRSL